MEMVEEALSHQNHQNHQLKNKSKIKEIVKDIPFFILLINGISILILSFADPIDYNQPFELVAIEYAKHMYKYDWLYSFVYEFSSFSVPLVIYMAFYAYLHRYCLYSWVCIIGLGLLNILNIVHYFVNLNYHQFYAGLIIVPCLTFAIIKWKQVNY